MVTIYCLALDIMERMSEELESTSWYNKSEVSEDGSTRIIELAPSVILKFNMGDITLDYRGRLTTFNATHYHHIEII